MVAIETTEQKQIKRLFAEFRRTYEILRIMDKRISNLEDNFARSYSCPFDNCTLSFASIQGLDQHLKQKGLHL